MTQLHPSVALTLEDTPADFWSPWPDPLLAELRPAAER
jgi:hypothetical protein